MKDSGNPFKILGVIPVRSTSHRLPRKVFLPLLGKPLLEQFIERVKKSNTLTAITLATPWGDSAVFDEIQRRTKIMSFQQNGIDDSDVLARLYFTASAFAADFIVRLNADNPCIDPDNIDMLVDHYIWESQDFKLIGTNSGDSPESNWPMSLGAEIYPIGVLHWMHHKLREPRHREHPHLYFHEEKKFREPPCPHNWPPPPLKFTVDTVHDYTRMIEIYEHFGNADFRTTELLRYVNDFERRDTEHLSS